MATTAATGTETKEHLAIKHHYATLVDILGKTVDPADFARKLGEKSLISDGIVQAASVMGIQTGPQRIAPVIEAVLAKIRLKADFFHAFLDILRKENSGLESMIQQDYRNAGPINPRKRTAVLKLTQKVTIEMKAMFNDLVVRISTILSQRMSIEIDEQTGQKTFQRFRQYVAGVCTNRRIQSMKSIEEIFDEITDKWCWDLTGDPYDLLLAVVNGVGNSKLIAELTTSIEECQSEHYSRYLVATKVADHIATLGSRKLADGTDYEPDFDELTFKLDDVNVNECSLAYLTDLWKAVKRCVHLPDLFSVLADIEEGCLSVTWLVPTYAVPALTRLPQSSPELFTKFSVLRMNINGVCFFDFCTCQETSAAFRAAKLEDQDEDPSPPSMVPLQVPLPAPQEEQQLTDSTQQAAQEGYDIEVVNDTGAYDCLVCHLIPRDPMQASCCGKRFCRTCITRVLSDKKACPHCQAKGDSIQMFEDQGQRQAILELKVYCPNKKQGCGWTGEVCHLNIHLNSDPARDTHEGCWYLELPCIHCFEHLPRHHMRSCPLQQYACVYCNYTASYRVVNTLHILECTLFPVTCSFCGRKMARKDFQMHKTECLLRKPLQGSAVPLPSTVLIPSHEFISPPTFIMTSFSLLKDSGMEWYSPPFYSHIGGYKMCLEVDAHGWERGTGTHLSVAVNLMRGEYDDDLFWPFRGEITFQLLNRRTDEGHVEDTVHFDDSASDSIAGRVTEGERASAGWGKYRFIPHSALHYDKVWNTEYLKKDSLEFQITRVEVTEQPLVLTAQHPPSGGEGMAPGKHSELKEATKKMEHEAGEDEPSSKTSSVGENRVITRTVQISALQQSSDLTQPDLPISPVTIILSSFITWKMRGTTWLSPSFYSHIGGYKMCLKVDANGDVDSAGDHVSVGVHLMRGKHDDYLCWPFRGDITLRLVNRRADEGHVEGTFPFDNSAPDSAAGRVTEGEVALRGPSRLQFISHSALSYNRNTGFLDKDSLEFRVVCVKVYSTEPLSYHSVASKLHQR